MHLRNGEKTLKVYRHHFFPYFIQLLKIAVVSFPFYLLLFLFRPVMSSSSFAWGNALVAFLFLLVIAHQSLIYWLDRFVVTNYRVVYIDWKLLTLRRESEAELAQLQDIRTEEKGVLAIIPFLDYGSVTVETAASLRLLTFEYAPDPESIRHFIFEIKEAHGV